MTLPAKELWLHHSATPTTKDAAVDMRRVERVGMDRFGQYPYSFAIHPEDGTILEGCGTRVGAHTARRNSTSFGVALIGNYDERAVKVQQIDAVRWLVAYLKADGRLAPGVYPTGGHRDVAQTACPGAKAYRLLDAMRVPWVDPTPKEVTPMFSPALDLEPIVAELRSPAGGVWLLAASGAIYAFGGAQHRGAANGQDYFSGRKAALLEANGDGYTIVAAGAGERYDY